MTAARRKVQLVRIDDNFPANITAHSVRGLCKCTGCGGMGHKDEMVSMDKAPWHTKCFRKVHGLRGVIALPKSESGKFRLYDLPEKEWRQVLGLPAKG